jgi:hypothetical protein
MGSSVCILEPTSSTGPCSPTRSRVVTPLLRVCIHCILCMICVILGLRMSQEIQLVVSFWRPAGSYSSLSRRLPDFTFEEADAGGGGGVMVQDQLHLKQMYGVSVGRHKILIRPWPHVNPEEMMMGYGLLRTVQLLQDSCLHGVSDRRPILAVTPTFVRPFQAVYLTGFHPKLTFVIHLFNQSICNCSICLFHQFVLLKVIYCSTSNPTDNFVLWIDHTTRSKSAMF